MKKDIKDIFILSFPIIIENILQTLLGTTDTFFAGKLSDNAIAGISITNVIMNIFISFFTAVSIGSMAVVSRNYGKKDFTRTKKAIAHSIVIGLSLGIFIGLICLIFYKQILLISGAKNTIINYVVPYYFSVAVPSVFLCLQLILSSSSRAIKDTKTPMYVIGLSNILNITLNAIFIKLGLGVLGLGLATTISRAISTVLLLCRILNHDKYIKLSKADFLIDKGMLKGILKISIPAGLDKLIMRIGQLIYYSMILSIGISEYVAHNIAGTIESYSYIPAMGFGLAISALVGISMGEGRTKAAERYTYTGYSLAAIFMVIIGIIFYVFAEPLASIFTETKRVKLLVVDVLHIIAFFQPFSALVQIITNALQGAGDTKFPMYSTIVGIWGIRLAIGYLLAVPLKYGLRGVWYAYALDLVVRGIILLIRFKKGKWKQIKI
ncbi:MATE family efflux transporter [Miniphocaeibacter halophilus]|uniref:MATE family efflux transporter n=1 Tax=Miniphocaeibacter halophilus TaxID=2931922 RepID=UPI001FB2844B|nr:MATE family efflux transporter [Miniphocaeibacter halophilus]